MRRLTAEWVAKAEEDYAVAASLARRRRIPANTVCFHCQQAIEKLLKGLLQEGGTAFPKTHDLEELLRLASPAVPSLLLLSEELQLLTDYAVRCRYPGFQATARQARNGVRAMRQVRATVLAILEGHPSGASKKATRRRRPHSRP